MSRSPLSIAALVASAMLATMGAQGPAPPPPPPPPSSFTTITSERVPEVRTQQIPIGTGEISGIVTAADTGRPLQNVMLTLNGSTEVRPAPTLGRGAAPTEGRGGAAVGRAAGVAGTLVSVAAGGLSLNRTTVTDRQGQFVFDKLPAGRFTMTTVRSQFLTMPYGARGPGKQGKTILLRAGQRLSLSVPMVRGSVVSGLVTGEDGEPMANARVQVYRYAFANGARRLQGQGSANTDDRGTYRVTNMQPGDYLVAATPSSSDLAQVERVATERAAFEAALSAVSRANGTSGPEVVAVSTSLSGGDYGSAVYAPTYFPGVPNPAAAATITLGMGEERAGIDIRTQPVRAGTIRGTVNIAQGFPFAVQISLLSSEPELAGMSQAGARANPDGTFVLRGVAPGNYVVTAQTVASPPGAVVRNADGSGFMPSPQVPREPKGAEVMWARAAVTVDGFSNPTVTLELRQGRSVAGQIVFEMARPPDLARSRTSVTLFPAGDNNNMYRPTEPALVQADGTFRIEGVVPGRYSLRAAQAKSAVVNGVDILDFPLELTGEQDIIGAVVTLSDRQSSLGGRISESNGDAAYDYTIIIAPDDPRYWVANSRRIATARPGNGGQFQFGSLPPGGYLLAALTDIENGAQYDPAFLKELAGAAMRVTITEGQRQVQDIRVR